jgi:hypothetical protein
MSYQAYLDSIMEKTGMSPEDFRVTAEQKGLLGSSVKAGSVVSWLKEDYGLGHGHAMAIYGTFKSASAAKEDVQGAVGKHFTGGRAVWQPTYERLVAKVASFGSDVNIRAGNSYISLLRSGRKFGIVQVTAQRVDVGIKLKGAQPTHRFVPAGTWNTMVTHRVRIDDANQVDSELGRWLRHAYDKA